MGKTTQSVMGKIAQTLRSLAKAEKFEVIKDGAKSDSDCPSQDDQSHCNDH